MKTGLLVSLRSVFASVLKPCLVATLMIIVSSRVLEISTEAQSWDSPLLVDAGSLALGAMFPGIAMKMWLVKHGPSGLHLTTTAYLAAWAFWLTIFAALEWHRGYRSRRSTGSTSNSALHLLATGVRPSGSRASPRPQLSSWFDFL